MPRITRWSPLTCDCVVEIETADDGQTQQFLLMNNICDGHKPLASKEFKAEHSKRSGHVMDLIEEAKAANLKQVDDQIAKEKSAFKRKDLMLCREQVLQFNARITEEWLELVSYPHAFDSAVHTQIKTEQIQAQNTAVAKATGISQIVKEQNG